MGTWERRAPLTGVIAFVLIALAFIIGGETPDFDASPTEALDFYVDNEGSQFAASILLFYGALFLALFAATLRVRLRRPGADSDALPLLSFVGGLVLALGILFFAGFTFTLADAGDALDPAAAQALNALNGDFFFPVAFGTALFMIGAGLAILRGAYLPRWLGWAAIVIGVVAATPGGFFGFLASGIWMVVAAIMLTTRAEPAAGAGRAPAA